MSARQKFLAALFGVGAALSTGAARAQRLDASATTLLAGRQDPRDGRVYTVVPAFQSLQLRLSEIPSRYVGDLKLVVNAWGQMAFGEPRELLLGDLDAGYLEGSLFKRRIHLRAGRQLVFGGAFRALQMDGATLSVRIARGLTLTGIGGAPVTPRFGTARGDTVGGARLSYRLNWESELGFSFVHVTDKGRVARQDVAWDLRMQPHRTLALSGFAVLSTRELRLVEADAQIVWQPHRLVEIYADWRRLAPDLFIPRSSIFSVFSQETRDEAGGSMFLRPHGRVRLWAHSHLISAEAGLGHRTGLKATFLLGQAHDTQLGLELRWHQLPDDRGFQQLRAFAFTRPLPSLFVTLDADTYRLDRPLNGQRLSFTGAATVGYEIGRGFRAVVSLVGDTTPLLESRFEGMVKIAWNSTVFYRQVSP
jgi:hypothetical protein